MKKVFLSQTSMAHTRWATHGVPNPLNCHPHVSDARTEFSLVHSEYPFFARRGIYADEIDGIITNCRSQTR